ncbi:MAG: hypothetical protein EA415_15895 [Sphaerobacteraceae bacterium]|nr:MAG: hypothetical protein EA415_15895 [Sphaerobacteraceae bacterium]
MEPDRTQIAVWFMLPVVGLLLLMLAIGARGGIFILPIIGLFFLLFIVPVWIRHEREQRRTRSDENQES